jgi:hypothetical protein
MPFSLILIFIIAAHPYVYTPLLFIPTKVASNQKGFDETFVKRW